MGRGGTVLAGSHARPFRRRWSNGDDRNGARGRSVKEPFALTPAGAFIRVSSHTRRSYTGVSLACG